MSKQECTHEFVATSRKGQLRVKVLSTNNRGKPQDDYVQTTVFECSKCGVEKEYPDEWEKNYVLPGDLERRMGRKKAAKKHKKAG